MKRFGDWAKVLRITKTMRSRFDRSVRQALMREAHFLRGKMVQGIAQQAPGGARFAPLSPITLAMRQARGFGGSKALIASGALRRSIAVVQVRGGGGQGGRVFVGVHRQAPGHGGRSMVDIAEIHEFGRTWQQTLSPKARRFLFAVLGKTNIGRGPAGRDAKGRFTRGKYTRKGGGATTIHIPPRPFIRPVIDEYGKPADVKKRFLDNLLIGMGGDFKLLGGSR